MHNQSSAKPIKLLLVDDDPMMRMLVKGHLDQEDYEIDEAVNGLEGLKRLNQKDYDLALVDLYMPEMNGHQLLKEIRKQNKYIGLVVLTSENDLDLSYKLLEEHDISDYLVKPAFTEMQLRFSVKNALIRRTFLLQQDSYISNLEYLKHQAEDAKSHFLTQMSHELNTPMNVILGFGQLLENMDKDFNDKQKAYIKHIVKAGWTLMEMIEKILTLSSVEFDILNLKVDTVELDDLNVEVIRNFFPEARNRDIMLLHNKGEHKVKADQLQLRAVIYALVSNAIIYNKQGGTVTVSSEELENGNIRINIKDDGIGIAKEKIEELFTPFNRLGAELKTVSGAGVGLALAQRLITAMHGHISVESEEGNGSLFMIELPSAQ